MKEKLFKLFLAINLILICFIIIFIWLKKASISSIGESLSNTTTFLKKGNYSNTIDISSTTVYGKNKLEAKLETKYLKIDDDYEISIKRYVNGSATDITTNYIKNENKKKYFYYYLNNKLEKEEITDISKKVKFVFDYNLLKDKIDNCNYVGKVKYNGKTLYKYSASINEYDAYNFIYSNDILTKKDSKSKTKIYFYIDKKEKIINKLYFTTKNIKKSGININYKISIETKKTNKKQIKIPE